MPQILLIQDSNEQNGLGDFFKNSWVRSKLPTGDYSVAGLENQIAIERKSLSDLLGTLTSGRERFEKELDRTIRTFRQFYIVIEGRISTIHDGVYDEISLMSRNSAWESIAALTVRYHCPFLFADRRDVAAALIESLLVKYAQEYLKTAHRIEVAARCAEI